MIQKHNWASQPLRLLSSWRSNIRHLLCTKKSLPHRRLRVKPAMKVNGWIASSLAMTFCLLLSSCEKEIEFKGEQTDPKLVINSLMEPGQPVKANISKSFFFLDNQANTTAPDDLVASLYVNGNLLREMTPHYDTVVSYDIWDPNDPNLGRVQKVYTYDYCPVVGDIIKITASANGFDDVEATTSPLPNGVDCHANVEVLEWTSYYQYSYDDVDDEFVVVDSLLSFYGDLVLTLDITDPNPGQSDCFKIYVENWKRDMHSKNSIRNYFEYDDPVFGSALPNNEYIDFDDIDTKPQGVFTDVLFDGRTYQLKFKMRVEMTLDEEYDPDFFQLPIRLEHLSKEYYYYLNTCDQGDMSMQLYAEPIQTYTNVKGGYGIVAGRAVDTLWFALPLEE